jgi:glycosyltransferase involved in cell wall biosynthesis
MTRILLISNFYPPYCHGGYEMSCADVASRLARRGHSLTVLTSSYRRAGQAPMEAPESVDVWRALEIYWDDHRLVTPPPVARARIEAANQRRLARALRRVQPEVVSVWNMGAMSLGLLATLRRRRVPTVYAVCNDWLVFGRQLDPWTRAFAGRPGLGRVLERLGRLPTGPGDLGDHGTFLFVSEWTRRWAEGHSGWHYADSSVVYSGIELGDFGPRPAHATRRDWSWRLLYVGRLEPDKGADDAVAALSHLPAHATLQVIGPGSTEERRRIEETARQSGVGGRVAFDEVSRAELADRYRAADAVVFPSRWQEPFGLVPLEAMACGTPVAATRTGGSAEFLEDGLNCVAFRPGDPADLARALRRLAGEPALRSHLVANGLATARELTVDRLADTFEEWLVAAAAGFPSGRPGRRRLPAARPA